MERLRLSLLSALVPLVCSGVLLVALVIWNSLGLPDPGESFILIEKWFSAYGLPLVFIAALLEGIAVVNIYVPGSAVIVLGVVFSRMDPSMAAMVVVITTIAFVLTAQANYAIGYFGLHNLLRRLGGGVLIDRAQNYWHKHGTRSLPLAFVHPNVGGFVSIAAGNGRYPWRKFFPLSILYISCWNTVWGFAAYFFADAVAGAATNPYFLLSALLLWAAISFVITYLREGR